MIGIPKLPECSAISPLANAVNILICNVKINIRHSGIEMNRYVGSLCSPIRGINQVILLGSYNILLRVSIRSNF